MPGATCTSSHPSAPKLSKICLAACVRIGAVRYSHFVMLGTLLGHRRAVAVRRRATLPAGSVHERTELVALGVQQDGPDDLIVRVTDYLSAVRRQRRDIGGVDVPVDAVLYRLRLRDCHEDQVVERRARDLVDRRPAVRLVVLPPAAEGARPP